ncbi:MAG: ACP phosphodiesterase [Spirochaetaceae bacterium]|nr:ACP phosphodiesterase [Spirochaetaceae bacterium]
MVLYINSCVRKDSRTERLAKVLLKKIDDEIIELKLEEENLQPYSEKMLELRSELASTGVFSDKIFKWANLFAKADQIVISAPFWDLSFPALLKLFIENIYVTGLVTKFDINGCAKGLCKAKKLYYVATAGGKFVPDFSYKYIESLCKDYFGIKETALFFAEMLDIEGFDAEKIIVEVENQIENATV